MKSPHQHLVFSAQKYVFVILAIGLTVASLYLGRSFFVPFAFSLLFAFILLPLVWRFERWGIHTVVAIIFSFLIVIAIFFGIVFFFGSQISYLISDFQEFSKRFETLLQIGIDKFNATFYFLPPIDEQKIQMKLTELAQTKGGGFLGTTFIQTSSFLATAFLVPVYVFLLLLYRKGIKMGILLLFNKSRRQQVNQILKEVQTVGKDYLVGIFILMIILAILNSISLLIIGVDYAIMFGCLAAILVVIPYIGTYLGAILPILYALITMDAQSAFFVLVAFVLIEALESNLLTPKIVGSNTSVNPLAAFVALIIGGLIWGIAGMILSIPFIAMLKKVFSHVVGLQPLAALLGEDIYEEDVISLEQIEREFYEASKKEENKKPSLAWRLLKIWFSKSKEEIPDKEEANLN